MADAVFLSRAIMVPHEGKKRASKERAFRIERHEIEGR